MPRSWQKNQNKARTKFFGNQETTIQRIARPDSSAATADNARSRRMRDAISGAGAASSPI
jgi:hypothetical protein